MKLYFTLDELKFIRARLWDYERNMNESLKNNPNAKDGAIRDSIEEGLANNKKILSYIQEEISTEEP